MTGRVIQFRKSNWKFDSPHPHLNFVKAAGDDDYFVDVFEKLILTHLIYLCIWVCVCVHVCVCVCV